MTDILVQPGYSTPTRCPTSTFENLKITSNPNLFDGYEFDNNGVVNYCEMEFCGEPCKFGCNREELEQFLHNVKSKTHTKMTFWTDWDMHPKSNKAEIIFNGQEFLYPLFDFGYYYENRKTKFDEKHVDDLQKILNKWI